MSFTQAERTRDIALDAAEESYRIHKDMYKKSRKMKKRGCKTAEKAVEDIRIIQNDHESVSHALKPIADIDLIKTCTVPKPIVGEIEEPQYEVNTEREQIDFANWAIIEENVESVGENSIDDSGADILNHDYHQSLMEIRNNCLSYRSTRMVERIDSAIDVSFIDDGCLYFEDMDTDTLEIQ